MEEMEVRYTVRLDNGRIAYLAKYECDECGWRDNDETFFYDKGGKRVCSLHR